MSTAAITKPSLSEDNISTFNNDPFALEYGQDYISAITRLEELILIGETGSNLFNVINFEASLGKSIQTDRIIKEYLEVFDLDNHRNFLIVKRFKKDVVNSVNAIGENFALEEKV